MNIFNEKHNELLDKLISGGVKFILVGGYAVVYYGYKRTTGDMDLWLEPTNENKLKLVPILNDFNFDAEGLEYIKSLDFTKHLTFHFYEEPERVDCLTYINGVDFSEAYAQKISATLEGLSIPIIHYNHLILSKIATDRAKDKADVEELQKINSNK